MSIISHWVRLVIGIVAVGAIVTLAATGILSSERKRGLVQDRVEDTIDSLHVGQRILYSKVDTLNIRLKVVESDVKKLVEQ